MKRPKRQAKLFPWQRVGADIPEYKREWIGSLMVGLKTSPDIDTLVIGLTGWLRQVVEMEKQVRRSRIVMPNEVERKILVH